MLSYFFISFAINIGISGFLIYLVVRKIKRTRINFFQPSVSETPKWFGTKLGIKLSLVLAITYAFLGVFIVETFTENGTGNFLFVWALGSPLIFITILPAVVYGTITGLFLAILISKFKHLFSSITSVLLGIALCVVITALAHYIFKIQVVLSFVNTPTSNISFGVYETYPFLIGIPSITYTLSGGWASWYIYKNVESEHNLS